MPTPLSEPLKKVTTNPFPAAYSDRVRKIGVVNNKNRMLTKVLSKFLDGPDQQVNDGLLIGYVLLDPKGGYEYLTRQITDEENDRLREYLGSPFAAAIPNRDILLCFRNDEETVARLREQIREDHGKMPHGVTDRILLVTADGIAPRE